MRVARLALLVFVASAAYAHDFWIEPSAFHPAAGKVLSASLRVGQDFLGDPVPRSTQLIDAFVVRDAKGEHDVMGFENQDPAGFVRYDGPAVIGYRSKGSLLEGSPEKFAKMSSSKKRVSSDLHQTENTASDFFATRKRSSATATRVSAIGSSS